MLQPTISSPSVDLQPAAQPLPGEAAADREGAGAADPVLCQHCGRTASNGISCEGYCVADSGY
jgi:hypothetical protein